MDGEQLFSINYLDGIHISGLMEYYMMLMANFTTDIIVIKDTCTQWMNQKHSIG